MEAAEKIPKKLYVYLDTTRGHHHRHGGKDVRHRGAGDRVRPGRKRGVWVYLLAVYDSIEEALSSEVR